ncbi:hypothetical protein Efla_004635 [Eimeria flavescens]
MIGEHPFRESDLDIVGAYEPTLTPPMAKLFQRVFDRAAANIIHAQAQQQFSVNQHRQPAEFLFSMAASSKTTSPGPWRCNRRKVGNQQEALKGTEPLYEVEHSFDWRTMDETEEYLMKWKGCPGDGATWEPIQRLDTCKDLLRAFRANRTRERRRTRREACLCMDLSELRILVQQSEYFLARTRASSATGCCLAAGPSLRAKGSVLFARPFCLTRSFSVGSTLAPSN